MSAMTLAVEPPIAPMLARLTRELPTGALTYEPKWDGFRCLAFADVDRIDLRSRHDRPLARYFPELVDAFRDLLGRRRDAGLTPGLALDGEILLDRSAPRFSSPGAAERGLVLETDDRMAGLADFAILMSRLHPAASRVDRLRRDWPARYVAFDLLAEGDVDLRDRPFRERRERLASIVGPVDDRIGLTPATRDPRVAERWLDHPLPGIDGVVAKEDDLRYEAGRRSMIKVKRLRTAECVVAGIRLTTDRLVGTLLLGLYDADDDLRHVGVVAQLSRADRIALTDDLAPRAVPLDAHPWRHGFGIDASPLGRLPGSAARWTPAMEHDWVPVRPERVVEVGYDQVDRDRFRHPARFIRARPDRDAASCRIEQITAPAVGVDGDSERPVEAVSG